MSSSPIAGHLTILTPDQARRLVVRAALLEGKPPAPDRDGVLATVRGLGQLQIDPTRTVERTQLLVLWSRLGAYDKAILDRLLWEERALFEYVAFITPLERLAEQRFVMDGFARRGGTWEVRAREWLAVNARVRRLILDRLRAEGALPSRAFTAVPDIVPWRSSGWTGGRNVSQMLELMHHGGEVMVARRSGQERLWDLPERAVPAMATTEALSEAEFTEARILRATHRLGVVTEADLRARVWYVPGTAVRATIDRLVDEGRLERVSLHDHPRPWYVSAGAVDSLPGRGRARTTLVSPFDPLVKDRERTERIFGFSYRLEMYVPRDQRRYGHFVLPILHGDRLVGRVDPTMDRTDNVLHIGGIHLEPGAPPEATGATEAAIERLAGWLSARSVVYAG